jgi:hypothetical protein
MGVSPRHEANQSFSVQREEFGGFSQWECNGLRTISKIMVAAPIEFIGLQAPHEERKQPRHDKAERHRAVHLILGYTTGDTFHPRPVIVGLEVTFNKFSRSLFFKPGRTTANF